jgi:hypothetical protein
MVTRAPAVDAFVVKLADARDRIVAEPDREHVLRFSRPELDAVRAGFADGIRSGEAGLHRLCALLGHAFLEGSYSLQSVVIGEAPSRERFNLIQSIAPETLSQVTDLDLGNRLLREVRMADGAGWSTPALVANFVEYQPHVGNQLAIHKMISRIKAEEEIWNKVCDELFHLDELVERDKILRVLSRYVKDVFGVKIVVGTTEDIVRVHAALEAVVFAPELLARVGVPATEDRLTIVETKDYVADGKRSGWEAMKSVVRWWDRTFEVQIQSLPNYFLEREYLTRESHAAFKAQREEVRRQVAEADPLFAFYLGLLRWLFVRAPGPAPSRPGLRVVVDDPGAGRSGGGA